MPHGCIWDSPPAIRPKPTATAWSWTGIVGPPAMGEQAQNGFHDMIAVPRAQGWDHQLGTEPILQLSYFQKVRFVDVLDKTTGRMFDVIPHGEPRWEMP